MVGTGLFGVLEAQGWVEVKGQGHLSVGTCSAEAGLRLQFLFGADELFPNSQPGVCKYLRPFGRRWLGWEGWGSLVPV